MSSFFIFSNPLVSLRSLKLHEMVGIWYGWMWVRFQAAVATCVLCSGEVLHLDVRSIPPGRIPPNSSSACLCDAMLCAA